METSERRVHQMKLYPTKQHKKAAEKFVEIFSKDKRVQSLVLICSCARGKAEKGSCVDIAVVIKDEKFHNAVRKSLDRAIKHMKETKELAKLGKYCHLDIEITTGKIQVEERDWCSGPDEFELEIGNYFAYGIILFDKNNYFKKLRNKWLPYYSEKLRKKRLKEVKNYCVNNLDHVFPYVKRKLYFQAFDRLYKATQEFMQALFIKKRVYPIAYDKWVKQQYVEILKMPELYKQIVNILSIENMESDEISIKAKKLKKLVEKYLK
jgi:predicted nucleotidyltransferase